MNIVGSMAYKRAVIDASVAVKWFSTEKDTDAAQCILASVFYRECALSAPDLIFYEVGNALGRGKRMHEENISSALDILFDSPIEFVRLDQTLMQATVHFTTVYGITFYDAAYGALAQILDAPLITANPKDHAKISEIRVIGIEKYLGT